LTKNCSFAIKFTALNAFNLQDYHYDLPTDKIAQEPLAKRDEAKLLVYRKGLITDHIFHQLPNLLPADSFLFFNNTKVIPARLFFTKPTGAVIEILLLEAKEPSPIVTITMEATKRCVWECMIGNKKRFKETLHQKITIGQQELHLKVELLQENEVVFTWDNEHISFAEILHHLGKLPLPPYIKREVQEADKERYQTVFAEKEGAVAAPTASLHFTEKVLENLLQKQIKYDFLTLHVGAGTFQPIKETDDFRNHTMHAEQIVVSRENIKNILQNLDKTIVAVGTTSMRTLESIYWFGAKIIRQNTKETSIIVEKLLPYNLQSPPSPQEALQAILDVMQENNLEEIRGYTEIFIFPGYTFKICKGIITNFHMPETTLILLIASFVGKDWREIYEHALANDYRFLSYGDSSLLLP
jgi:S-adenosylmethionine:tRNA ribosyltransferase-isomerase